jgi:hypothetical protein
MSFQLRENRVDGDLVVKAGTVRSRWDTGVTLLMNSRGRGEEKFPLLFVPVNEMKTTRRAVYFGKRKTELECRRRMGIARNRILQVL